MKKSYVLLWSVCLAFLFFLEKPFAEGHFVSIEKARSVAKTWLEKTEKPMGETLGLNINDIVRYQGDEHGNPGYYVVFLEPHGWLIIPADDSLEPVIAFGEEYLTSKDYEQSPLHFLLNVNVQEQRSQNIFPLIKGKLDNSNGSSRLKRWELLDKKAPFHKIKRIFNSGIELTTISNDILVEPLLVNNTWEQEVLQRYDIDWYPVSDDQSPPLTFYNLYTMWDGIRYPVGCNALAMAQIMKYWSFCGPFPETPSKITLSDDITSRDIEVPFLCNQGGVQHKYNFELMDISPDYETFKAGLQNEDENDKRKLVRKEIASFLHDIGLLLNSIYSTKEKPEGTIKETVKDPVYVSERLRFLGYQNVGGFISTDIGSEELYKDIIFSNLDNKAPLIIGAKDHTFNLDGYGFQEYSSISGKIPYYHFNISAYTREGVSTRKISKLWFNGDSSIINGVSHIICNMSINPIPALISGRLWFGCTPISDAMITINGVFNGSQMPPQIISCDSKGVFAFPAKLTPMEFSSVYVENNFSGLNLPSSDITNLIPHGKEHISRMVDSYTARDPQNPQPVSNSNRWWGDIVLEQALVSGVTDTMKKGVSRFNVPMPSALPKQALEWDFRGLSAVYVSAYPYAHLAYQPWFGQFFDKLAEFVKNGGTAYIEADSWKAAALIARRAGVNLTFYDASEIPLYYGGEKRRIIPYGDLRAAMGKSSLYIPYKPYEVGSGGPLIKTMDGAWLLSNVEVVLLSGQDAFMEIYPAAISFPYGQGMVYYTGFPVPSTSSSAFLSLRQDNRTPSAERALADWFLSKPIANVGRMSTMRSAGISNAKIVGRSDGTVSRAKGFGLLVELPASEDVTVAAQMSRLGMKGAGAVLEDAASRRWTASLLAPDGRVYDVRTTSGDVLSFSVVSGENEGGTWQVRLDAVSGYPEENLFVVTAALGLKDMGGVPGSGDVPPDVPVTGLRVEPDSADLEVGERLSLRAVLSPSNTTDKRVSWSVSKPSVASTDASGNILALAEGTTFVRATAADGIHSADCTIRVTRAAVLPTALALTPKSLLLTVDESAALAVSFTPPETTERDVTWSTSNPAVATVLGGSVQAVGVGTARITATSAADAGVRAVCSVTVRKKNGGGGTPEELAYYRGRYPDHNVMIASDGDSELLGTDGPDVLVGGSGDNWLEGKGGNDIYVQNLGGGHDTISNRSSGANDVDELHFGPGIIPETLFPYRKGGDLVFSLPDERGEESASTTVEDWYEDAGARLDRIVFMDGTAWTAEDAEKRAGNPPVVLKGGSGADRMKTRSRKKDTVVLYGLEGDDRLKDGKGDDVFVGGPGDDFIQSWSLVGGKSHKTFIWNRGDGDDMVDFYFFGQKSGQRRGLLRLGLGIAPGEVSLERRGGSVRVVLPGGSVTFKKARWFTGFHHPDAIVFADGTTWQWRDIPQK